MHDLVEARLSDEADALRLDLQRGLLGHHLVLFGHRRRHRRCRCLDGEPLDKGFDKSTKGNDGVMANPFAVFGGVSPVYVQLVSAPVRADGACDMMKPAINNRLLFILFRVV